MPPPREPVVLSAAALGEMLAAHDMGDPHITMAPTPMWYPPDERRAVSQEAWREFAGQGLTDRDGALRDGVFDWLPALAHGGVEYFGWASETDGDGGQAVTAYLVVPLGHHAMLATRRGDEIQVAGADGRAPVEALIDHLPPACVPGASSLNVSQQELARRRGPDVLAVLDIVREPPCGLGELYVRVYDAHGHPHTTDEPLRYRDVRDGRWMIRFDGGHLSLLPATSRLFQRELYGSRDRLGR